MRRVVCLQRHARASRAEVGHSVWLQHCPKIQQPRSLEGTHASLFPCIRLSLLVAFICVMPCAVVSAPLQQENLDSAAVALDDDDIKAIDALNCNMRFNDTLPFWGVDIWGQ